MLDLSPGLFSFCNKAIIQPLFIFLAFPLLEGSEGWRAAVKKYESKIDRVETQITDQLSDKLATAKNASEMFRVFSKFNALFFRPRVREAIHLYQAQLIERVKDDIKVLLPCTTIETLCCLLA